MKQLRILSSVVALAAFFTITAGELWAHCDTMNGPVVKAARLALDEGDVRYALVWVQPSGEQEIRAAFAKTQRVRALGSDAKALADMSFFETLVRVHRAGEGEPYTGLKGAEVQPEPGIAAAEKALEANSVNELLKELDAEMQTGVKQAFGRVQSTKGYKLADVEGGRRFVEAYVNYIHHIERLHQALAAPEESGHAAGHQHH